MGLVAGLLGWGMGGVLTVFRADRICLKKRYHWPSYPTRLGMTASHGE